MQMLGEMDPDGKTTAVWKDSHGHTRKERETFVKGFLAQWCSNTGWLKSSPVLTADVVNDVMDVSAL